MPRIYVLSGPDLGRTFDVQDGATFGRTTECAVPLRDASVSRMHARLEREGTIWRVVDAGSRNGLFLGTERVTNVTLDDGGEFRLGEVVLRFRAEIVAVSAPPAAAPPAAAPSAPAPPAAAPRVIEPEPVIERAPAPEIRFETRGRSRAAPEAGEIELEGDWNAAPPAREERTPSRATAESAPPRPARADATAATRSVANDERARKLAAAGIASTARGTDRDARGILQFHKVAQADGVLRQDFGQQSSWLRTLIVVIIAAVMVALAWFGYRAATAAKATLMPTETVEDESR